MADHIRKQIRDAIESTLTGLATTGSNVFVSRIYPTEEDNLPGLLISTPLEDIDLEQGTLDAPERILTALVRGRAKSGATLDDTLDKIAKEVEVAMGADITLGGLSKGLDLAGMTTVFSGEGDQPYGEITLTYFVYYRTPFGDPDSVA